MAQRSSGLQWMAASFGLMGIIVGFSFGSFGGSVQAQTTGTAPSVVAPSAIQAAVIRPPDPNAPQGGGCGGGANGGGCGGGARGRGCGAPPIPSSPGSPS